ncbi:hypothetical protein [Amaricoccus sp.]|nr:hypothetical protein [Amaricoccus sp.]
MSETPCLHDETPEPPGEGKTPPTRPAHLRAAPERRPEPTE